ncbi:hypothetical protein ACH5RR_000937 [Cinchona calisaya]|uniref:Uncharacterized protein n=1 Tax=Cinchona calisaya TaxID=153742 RepID=A0ABD3B281_9GENT
MGKWNRRWIPRGRYNNKRYQDYDYEQPPPSPPSPHHSQSNPPAIQDTNGSSWEIDFCKSVRVPWQKVVTAKKYMYCNENVVKWDDSAGEEAFHNAKTRYWEKINGIPCETPLPDQDVYIDDIDWNPDIDPGLISDLDQEYFNPNETENNEKIKIAIKGFDNPDPGCDPDNINNLWERFPSHGVNTLKGASSSWGKNDKLVNLKNSNNPWEQSSETVESLKNNSWKRRGDESSGWNQELRYNKQYSDANNFNNDSWNRGCQDVGYNGEMGWRQDNSTRGWKQWNISGHEPQRSGNTFKQNNFASHTGAPRNKGWMGWEGKQPKDYDFRGPSESSCRKREGSFQQRSRYKTSRFQIDDQGAAYQWEKEKSQKTVRFYV